MSPWPLIGLVIGLGGVIAAACAVNNVTDRDIDAKMARTQARPLPTGTISPARASIFAIVSGLGGLVALWGLAGVLAACLAAAGFVAYTVLYAVAKRRTVHATLIGSISGAIPPLVGYAAGGGSLDITAAILFAVMVVWQMPHFYAIAMFRAGDYAAAGIPVLPVRSGMYATKVQILAYVVAFVPVALLLSYVGEVGYTYAVVMLVVGVAWIWRVVRGFNAGADAWAKRLFGHSLIVLLVWSLLLAAGRYLP